MTPIALCGLGEHGLGRGRRQACQQRQRVLVAAVAQHVDGVDHVGFAGAGHGEDDRGARLELHALDRRILFRGDRLLERRQGGGVARLEHGFGGSDAARRVGRHQFERAERGGDGVADAVVDPDLLGVGGFARHGLAGGGVEIARRGLDVGLAVGREIELAVLERGDDVERPFIAAGGDGIDRLGGGRIAVAGELGERVVEGPCPSAGHRHQQHEDRDKKRQEAAQRKHHVFQGRGAG